MIIIAHRGNLNGPNPELENKPDYINQAIVEGFDVEVDVWAKDGKLFLGHDGPETETTLAFLDDPKIWCHAKNTEALGILQQQGIHCFFIQENDLTFTSKGIIYGYSGRDRLPPHSVSIFEDNLQDDVMGVCTDYPIRLRNKNENRSI